MYITVNTLAVEGWSGNVACSRTLFPGKDILGNCLKPLSRSWVYGLVYAMGWGWWESTRGCLDTLYALSLMCFCEVQLMVYANWVCSLEWALAGSGQVGSRPNSFEDTTGQQQIHCPCIWPVVLCFDLMCCQRYLRSYTYMFCFLAKHTDIDVATRWHKHWAVPWC